MYILYIASDDSKACGLLSMFKTNKCALKEVYKKVKKRCVYVYNHIYISIKN